MIQKSYGKKGQDVVDMNWAAVDAGIKNVHKVEVPASWLDAKDDAEPEKLVGRTEEMSALGQLWAHFLR